MLEVGVSCFSMKYRVIIKNAKINPIIRFLIPYNWF